MDLEWCFKSASNGGRFENITIEQTISEEERFRDAKLPVIFADSVSRLPQGV